MQDTKIYYLSPERGKIVSGNITHIDYKNKNVIIDGYLFMPMSKIIIKDDLDNKITIPDIRIHPN